MNEKERIRWKAKLEQIGSFSTNLFINEDDYLTDGIAAYEEHHSFGHLGPTPLEYILGRIEQETFKLLDSIGRPTRTDAYTSGESLEAYSAARVLGYLERLRGAIKSNDAEKAALYMLRMMSALCYANLNEIIENGLSQMAGRKVAGKASKRSPAINTVVRDLILKSKKGLKATAAEIWRMLPGEDNAIEWTGKDGNDYQIYRDADYLVQKIILRDGTTKPKSIQFDAFRKNYVSPVKKYLKQQIHK